MFNKIETNRIKKILGKHYTTPILKEFARKKILNTKEQPYLAENIRKLVAGEWENELLEHSILKFVKRTEQTQKRNAEARKKLMKK